MGREDRWQAVLQASFALDTDVAKQPAALTTSLDGLLEVFAAGVDPLDDFEGYAMRRLLLALRAATLHE